jgi:hypothetical protein
MSTVQMMTNIRRGVFIWGCAVLILVTRGFSFQVPLTVEERAGVERVATPLTAGVPFAQGTIYSDQDVQIAGLPGQFTALSSWPDGSVKWLLCDVQADVSANGQATYYLTDGSGNATGTELTATEYADSIVVVTGPLKFIVSRTDFNLFQRLWLDLDEDGQFEADEAMISHHPQDGAIVRYDSGEQYFAALDPDVSVELEETGPLRTTIRADGWHRNAGGQRGLDFTVRIHAYAGKSFVRVFYTFYNRQSTSIGGLWTDPPPESYIDVEDISLRSHLNLQGAVEYAFGGSGGAVHDGSLSGDERAYIYAYGTVVPDDLHYLIGADGSGSGTRAKGWADVSDSRWGLTTAVGQFWQQHPKGIEVAADGEVWVRMIPEYYDGTPINPSDSYTAADLVYCGAAKTHEILYYFHPGDRLSAESENLAHSFDDPLFAVAPPLWYASSGAFGKILPQDVSLIKPEYRWIVQAWEDTIETMYDDIIRYREGSRWTSLNEYGMWNYGDSWQAQWSNMQYDTPYSLFTHFIRTGDLRYFDLACDQSRHYRDVDIYYHYGDVQPGTLREAFLGSARALPNKNHGLGYDNDYMGDISVKGPGLIYHYFLTGDRLSLYGGKMQADYVKNSALRYDRDYIFYGPRKIGLGMEALLFYYDASGDESYLNNGVYHVGDMDGSLKASAYTLARKLTEFQNISPENPDVWAHWGYFGCDTDDGLKFESCASLSRQAGLAWDALIHYYELSGDTVARDDILRGAAWMCDPARSNLWNGSYFYAFDPTYGYDPNLGRDGAGTLVAVLGFAYEHTGNVDYLDKGISALNVSISGISMATTDPKIFAQRTRQVPRFFYYLSEEYGIQDSIPPNPPTGLTAPQTTEHSISLSWTPPGPASDGDVASSYAIYRDLSPLGTSVGPQYEDEGLPENHSYDYAVFSVDNAGNYSVTAAIGTFSTSADDTPPTVSAAGLATATQLEIVFSEPVEESSAENVSHYEIDHGISVASAVLQGDLKTVLLITTAHQEGTIYTVTINGVRDRAVVPNTIAPNTQHSYELQLQLVVTDINIPGYQDAHLQVGDEYYIDRSYTIVGIPAGKENLTWIKTANDDKNDQSAEFLTFTVNQDVTAYVAYDHRGTSLPNWIALHYTDTGEDVLVSDSDASPLHLWSRQFPAGTVSMGGNLASGASGALAMYVVLLAGQGPAPLDTIPPVISQVAAGGITDSAAVIEWTTSEPADARVEYGLTAAYGSSSPLDSTLDVQHAVSLWGLVPETLYHYRVHSADQLGNAAFSGDRTFQTQETGDHTPPQISQVEVSGVTDSSALVTWTTDELSTSQVEYGFDTGYGFSSPLDATLTINHQVEIWLPSPAAQASFSPQSRQELKGAEGRRGDIGDRQPEASPPEASPPEVSPPEALRSETRTMGKGSQEIVYHYRVLSADASENLAVSEDDSFAVVSGDTTPPQILDFRIWSVRDTSALVDWSTDEPARATLHYGLEQGSYPWSLEDTSLTMMHQFNLSELTPATTYHLQAWSADQQGNWSVAPDTTLVTKHLLPKQPGQPIHYDD